MAKKTKAQRKSSRRDYSDFIDFVESHPELNANQLQREYRKEGGKIGNEKSKELTRDVRGQEKNLAKVTRITYYGAETYPLGRKELRKRYEKARYIYIMAFDIEREGYETPDTDYLTIAYPDKLTFEELVMHTLQAWEDGQQEQGQKYKAISIIQPSIILIKAIDMEKE